MLQSCPLYGQELSHPWTNLTFVYFSAALRLVLAWLCWCIVVCQIMVGPEVDGGPRYAENHLFRGSGPCVTLREYIANLIFRAGTVREAVRTSFEVYAGPMGGPDFGGPEP